jgi:hypothetical protein
MDTGVYERLRKVKVFTIDALAQLLNSSVRTAWRRLQQWQTFTSYNHNAKYHALASVPRFDAHGIWRYDDICFSRYGNLTKTVVHFVDEAVAGIDVQELCTILGISATSLYTHFRGIKQIAPQRIGRTLVLFSSQSDIRYRQAMQRNSQGSTQRSSCQPKSTDAVLILVDRIKNPDDSVEQCARRLQLQSPAITPERISALLSEHGVLKKKTDTP